MGWSIGWDGKWQRDIGYGVPAICDFPKCNEEIDRGLSFVCGDSPYGGDDGCGLYFCPKHRNYDRRESPVCSRCGNYRPPFEKKPDVKRWIDFKMSDESWEEWRKENGLTRISQSSSEGVQL